MRTIGYNRISSAVIVVPEDAEIIERARVSIKPHIKQDGVEKKHCCCCGEWLPLSCYYRHAKNHDQLQSFCKGCSREAQTASRMG